MALQKASILLSVLASLSLVQASEQMIYESCDLAQEGQDCVNYPYDTCQITDVSSQEMPICQHKPLMPLLSSEIFPTIFLPLLLGIASVAGVGGGMVVVPIAICMFHFSSKEAIAVSTAIVFETAILRFVFFSAWTKHPENENKTEIDYNTVRVVWPLFLVGSYVGVIFYILMSEMWITILIIGTLGPLSLQMIWKARQKFMAESVKIAEEKAAQSEDYQRVVNKDASDDQKEDVAINSNLQLLSEEHSNQESLITTKTGLDEKEEEELATILERERSACSQWRIQLQTFGLTALSILINLIRGSPKNDSIIGMDKCGATSWSLLGSFIVLCLGLTWYNVHEVRRELDLKRRSVNKKAMVASDIDIEDKGNLAFILVMAFIGSFLGNALGLGGGFIYNPVQLSMGVAPSVAASTSMYMIMFSAITSTLLLFIYGQVNMAYVGYLSISCGIGVILGMYFIGKLLKKWKRQSIVAICLAVILTVATAMSGYSNIVNLKQQKANGLDIYTGGELC